MKIIGNNLISNIFDQKKTFPNQKESFKEVSDQGQDEAYARALFRYEKLKLLRGSNSVTLVHPDDADKFYQELSQKYDIHHLTSDEAVELGLSLRGSGLLSDEESHAIVVMCLIIGVQKEMPYTTDPNATYDVFTMIDNQLKTDLRFAKNEAEQKMAHDLWGKNGHAYRGFRKLRRLNRYNPIQEFRPINNPVQIKTPTSNYSITK